MSDTRPMGPLHVRRLVLRLEDGSDPTNGEDVLRVQFSFRPDDEGIVVEQAVRAIAEKLTGPDTPSTRGQGLRHAATVVVNASHRIEGRRRG